MDQCGMSMDEGPDRGRAWLVALAGFVINFLSSGIYRSHGLIFVSMIDTFQTDRQSASLPFSVRTAVRNFAAPVIGIIGQKYSASAVIISGGILGTLSTAACFFATNLTWITISWGLIYGVATALIIILPQVVINQYFIKYRTTASGINFSGSCIGSIVFPLILEYLLNEYGLHGTFLIMAGILLNTVPAAMLIKMPSWWEGDKLISFSTNVYHGGAINKTLLDVNNKTIENAKSQLCERGTQVGNGIHDNYQHKKHAMIHSRLRSYSCTGLIYQMNNLPRTSTMPSLSTIENNSKRISSNSENIFDIDLDYLKQNSDLLFQMILMEIPNREISYRAILLEVEQDDLWHPDKAEVMQEIENIYYHIENTLEIDPVSSKKVKANGLYIKKTLGEALTKSKRSESVRAVKRYFRTYKDRGLKLSKIRSAPNFSNIYNELAKKDYVLSKLKQLCNSNEIRIISHLSHNNPKDVLKVLFQIRTLYKIYNDIEANDIDEFPENCDKVETGDILFIKRASCSREIAQNESVKITDEQKIRLWDLVISAIKLHGDAIFLLLVVTRATFFLSFLPVETAIVDFAIYQGFDEEDMKFIISVLAFGDLVGRIGLGWITDQGYVSNSRYMLVSLCVLSLCTAAIPLMYTIWMLYISVALFGMLQGSLFVRHPVLVTMYLSPQKHSIAIGCMELSGGFISLLIPVYIGFFRDTMGTYNPIFYINGGILFLSGICWLLEPSIIKRKENLEHDKVRKSGDIELT